MPGMKRPMSRAAATKQARRMGKQAMTSDAAYSMMKKGGKAKKKSKFPNHSGDGKITKKDILMAKGIIPKTKKKTTRRK